MQRKIRIIGIGGSLEAHSSTLAILKYEMKLIESLGAQIQVIDLKKIKIPLYKNSTSLNSKTKRVLDEIHSADGFIFASPEYHGTVSASFKNVIDYFEFLANCSPPYLTGKPVGCIAAAGAENAGATTLQTIFNIVHNLRGISASNSFAIGSANRIIGRKGELKNEKVKKKLRRLAEEVFNLALKLK
jgi:FMN reductase